MGANGSSHLDGETARRVREAFAELEELCSEPEKSLNERWAEEHGYPIVSVTEVLWFGPALNFWPVHIGYVTDGSVYVRDDGILLHMPAPAAAIFKDISARRAAERVHA